MLCCAGNSSTPSKARSSRNAAIETFKPLAILHSTLIDGTLRPDSICASIALLTPVRRASASMDK
ncbi:hypothetical protein KPSA1_03927 [Pseudomonas syringae pv. actinidiae]|uniref:Uncharacterized protein n=1 Tax=Pseudomonas syringae pv. actinidiae TaxID=103796 RepID=A0A2V0QBW9_PSESF|nr:hypothetical protein KPSA1_03927 [Pseudomonas syringae pv. actinidiae]